MFRLRVASAALALGALIAPAAALAQNPALVSFTGGTLFSSFQSDGDTIGWSFTVDRPLTVTHLGYWDGDAGTGNPIVMDHPVGLWNSAGNLLTSNVVTPTSPFTGAWRYQPTASVNLAPGTTYHLGAFVANNPGADGYMSGTTARTLATGFTGVASLRDPDGPQTGLVFPSVTGAFTGRFGPNLLFVEIPEPSAAVALFAPAALALRRQRRRA